MQLILHLVRLFFRGSALAMVLLAAGLGVAGLGGAFSDRLDIPNHFAPVWAVLGLAGAVVAAIVSRRGERWAIIALGVLALASSGVQIAPELIAASRHKPAVGPATLKVIQFNAFAKNKDPDKALAWILEQDADIVLLEEGGSKAWPIVAALRRLYPFAVSCAGAHRGCDSWIFSKKQMIDRGGLYEDGDRFAGAWATLADADGPFTVVVTHYVWPAPAGAQQAQTRYLAEVLKRFDKQAMIVGGDFNSAPWSWSLRRQDKLFGLQRRTLALASWPASGGLRIGDAPFPLLPIDHVYAGKAWTTVSVKRGPPIGSDHLPIVVTLRR
ncbi:endonuclease/exonuclease/phosphatase family protein [Caulobacter hibisci]|uniref:Endonuclease/exonuclease/phosphatase family protein n=1 Tax=Caulobacter hibisci TaxID=2035993 RepID=A0ABS0T4B3_9CAUL|nr:endonuclease/exonuclease/phosphatase family protein [Caulobacter hibisci]MBI1686704.1 endonuclease/exonuclease/phosphatase family protein [Caulobacter hibisci]